MRTIATAARVASLALVGLAISGCAGAAAPASSESSDINLLWWIMLAISAVVAVIVLGLLATAMVRPGGGSRSSERKWNMFTLIGGGAIPLVILIFVFAFSLVVMRNNQGHRDPDLVVTVQAKQWDYTFTYPGHPLTEQDVLHLPAHRLIKLELSSDDVIHSFWVPELQGKMDMFRGRTTTLWIDNAEPGAYEARCAEFCGLKHALMRLPIQVDSPEAFDAWLESQAQ
ncbi:MAG: cytochrome c oxidase subunit II [Dehalococcoidia bacterium]